MIHICMAMHDKTGEYSMFTAVAMKSVIMNTKETIMFHLLHDSTLDEITKGKFIDLVGINRINFYDVVIPKEWESTVFKRRETIGTLFRLLIPDYLTEVRKIIYLDSDLIVNMNIKDLWDLNFNGKLILGKKDIHKKKPTFEGNEDAYINAGVMVWDLKKIREKHNLKKETCEFLELHPNCVYADQDVINNIFVNEIGLISDCFNTFTRYIRNDNDNQEIIYHFAAGDIPRLSGDDYFDRLFYKILREINWNKNESIDDFYFRKFKDKIESIKLNRLVCYQIGKAKGIIFWGAKQTHFLELFLANFDLSSKQISFVDANYKNIDGGNFPYSVYPVEYLDKCDKKDIYIIIIAYRHYDEIKTQLIEKEYKENLQFINIQKLFDESEYI